MLLHIFYGLHLYMKVSAVCFICCFRMSVNGNDNNGNGTVAKLVKRYENGSHNACAQMRASRSVQYITRVYVLCSLHINVPTFHYVFVFVHTFMCYTHTRKHTHTVIFVWCTNTHIHSCMHARTHALTQKPDIMRLPQISWYPDTKYTLDSFSASSFFFVRTDRIVF